MYSVTCTVHTAYSTQRSKVTPNFTLLFENNSTIFYFWKSMRMTAVYIFEDSRFGNYFTNVWARDSEWNLVLGYLLKCFKISFDKIHLYIQCLCTLVVVSFVSSVLTSLMLITYNSFLKITFFKMLHRAYLVFTQY